MNWLPLIVTVASVFAGGIFTYSTVILLLGIHPLLDVFFKRTSVRPVPAADLNLWLHSFAQVLLVVGALVYVAHATLKTYELVGIILSVGFCSGIGFTAAHELIHRRERWERGLGMMLLASTMYMHYRVEHVFGHHKNVATLNDPATARKNEGLYFFWVRSIIFSFLSAWQIEKKRCGGKFFHRKNRMLHYLLVEPLILYAVYFIFGVRGIIFFLCQSLVAILLLEAINYVEHYGLLRAKNAKGDYEPFTVRHSWDSSHELTNRMFFNVGRHAQHHQIPSMHYQDLAVIDAAPQLPLGYVGMLLLSFLPPLWKNIMNKCLQEL